ncbi:oligosaccharide flippase family protein [Conexibacter sp. W3-3-2]|nr:oligosaccharide flippase family protein [Conexibacter sp. W3-3-2]
MRTSEREPPWRRARPLRSVFNRRRAWPEAIVSRRPAGRRASAPYGTRGGSAAMTPGPSSRSSTWSRRMNPSSARGSRSRATGRPVTTGNDTVRAVGGYLKRLVASGAAYQAAGLLASLLALVTLPLYTRHLTTADYGYAETLLTFVILGSILLRAGVGEALVRFWFDDEDHDRRIALARATTGFVVLGSTAVLGLGLLASGPLSQLLLGTRDRELMAAGLLGLWAFTNLEIAYALLRVEERRRAYLAASLTNVLLTVGLTVTLVVGLDAGAVGYVLGNYAASTVVLLGVWWSLRDRVRLLPAGVRARLAAPLAFGLPTVPAEATVFLLNVVDRAYLLRVESPAAAGVYAVAVKLATAVIVAVRAFQSAWPPLVYSVGDDDEARRLYAFITTLYVLVTGATVAALALLSRQVVDLLAGPDFVTAHEALPWLALGWALYGLNLVLVTIAGRAKVTTRNFPAALAGVAVNVLAMVLLVPPLGIAGAGIALAVAYLVMIAVLHLLTRRLFVVPFEWRRLALAVAILSAVAVSGELLLPTAGAVGWLSRVAWLAWIPVLLLATRFLSAAERARLRALLPR